MLWYLVPNLLRLIYSRGRQYPGVVAQVSDLKISSRFLFENAFLSPLYLEGFLNA